MAILWLVLAWMWTRLGVKTKKGIKFLVAGAAWLLFYNAFQVLAGVLSDYGAYSIYIEMIGKYIGGILAWLFALIGAIYIVMESWK